LTPLLICISIGQAVKPALLAQSVIQPRQAQSELIMRTKLCFLFIALALLAGINQTAAQGTRFFRISGPAATTITAFRPDGTLVWSNALPGATYTVQTVSALPGSTNWVDYVQIPTTNGVNTNQVIAFNPPAGMALIPAGSFTMGDILDDILYVQSDAIATNVYVSAFYMDVNLVSSNQWRTVYSYATSHGYSFVHPGLGKAGNHPVETVDWYDCVKWSNARSQQAGLTPVYYTDAGLIHVYTNGETDAVYVNWTNSGYRLPTEAEWEKAARGGLSGQRFPWGDTISWSQANYFGDPLSLDPNGYAYDQATAIDYDPAFSGGDNGNYPYTSPVGSFPANGYGLNDMAGNVMEWCWDWYAAPTYPAGSPYLGGTDPRGPAGPLTFRVFRGGYWLDIAYFSRCAYRDYDDPGSAFYAFGFRCVRGISF
jgi:sulfatase modifying factor 1